MNDTDVVDTIADVEVKERRFKCQMHHLREKETVLVKL